MQQIGREQFFPVELREHFATLRDLENLAKNLPTKDDWWALKKVIQEEQARAQARHQAEAQTRERYWKYIAILVAISAAFFSTVIALLIAMTAG